MNKKKIALLTGGRPDYSLLKPLMNELLLRKNIQAGFLVTGTHLSKVFGMTIEEIKKDKYPIWGIVDAKITNDTPAAICKSIAHTLLGISNSLKSLKPDLIVLLGDRYELLAAAQAALIHNIPIAHLHGGESTEGLIDEAIRHSVTKMAHLHFVSNKFYLNRILQMGENPNNVFNFGAIGIDNIKNLKAIPKNLLIKGIGLNPDLKSFLITYHPVTLDKKITEKTIKNLLKALLKFQNINFIFTYPNSDQYGSFIINLINKFIKRDNISGILVKNLGSEKYLNLIKNVDMVIGNSSSGIIEVPSFGVPTINIGSRQKGRLQAKSVIDAKEDIKSIEDAIKQGMTEEFIQVSKTCINPYGRGNTAKRIASTIEKFNLKGIIMKSFYDLDNK